MNKAVLNSEQIRESSLRIAEHIFKHYKKTLTKEIEYIQTQSKAKEIDMSSIISLMIASLVAIDSNVIIMARNAFKLATKNDLDLVRVMNFYLQDLMSLMNEDEQKRLKEKMN